MLACLELHTYSSLDAAFLKDYKNTLQNADIAVVFYSPKAVAIKGLETISAAQIKQAFDKEDLIVYTNPKDFENFIVSQKLQNTVLLLMSSGNYGDLDLKQLAKRFS